MFDMKQKTKEAAHDHRRGGEEEGKKLSFCDCGEEKQEALDALCLFSFVFFVRTPSAAWCSTTLHLQEDRYERLTRQETQRRKKTHSMQNMSPMKAKKDKKCQKEGKKEAEGAEEPQ